MPGWRIHVVAGVLFDAAGRVLVARRPRGTHLAGLWEFPGGKLMHGESREIGLGRELAEELGVRVLAAHPLIWVEHRYPDRDIVLDVWRVESYAGEPHGREGQPVEWREIQSLDSADFPPADAPVLAALRLPRRYLVTPEPGRDWSGFLDRLAVRVTQGFDLVQLRAKSLDESDLVELGRRAAEICRRGGAKLLVNADPQVARRCGAGGVHLTRQGLARMLRGRCAVDGGSCVASERTSDRPPDAESAASRASQSLPRLQAGQSVHGAPTRGDEAPPALRPDSARRSPSSGPSAPAPRHAAVLGAATGEESRMGGSGGGPDRWHFLTGASCHDAGDLDRARAAGCDFAVLGPVRETATHPGVPVLHWSGFERLARGAGMPVFAIGGLGDGDIVTASRSGGHGVAAIRAFWGAV